MLDDDSVFDLFELSHLHKKHHGVSLVKGPDPNSPAYKILNPNLIPSVPELSFRDLIDSIQSERGFIFTANLKQAKRTRGSLISVERTDGTGSVFEIISNGKANTVDLVYRTASGQHVVSIEDVSVANGHWRNITVFVQEDRAQVYVGCEEINTQELDVPIQQILSQESADIASLRIAKGAAKSDRFMVRQHGFYRSELHGYRYVILFPSNAYFLPLMRSLETRKDALNARESKWFCFTVSF